MINFATACRSHLYLYILFTYIPSYATYFAKDLEYININIIQQKTDNRPPRILQKYVSYIKKIPNTPNNKKVKQWIKE